MNRPALGASDEIRLTAWAVVANSPGLSDQGANSHGVNGPTDSGRRHDSRSGASSGKAVREGRWGARIATRPDRAGQRETGELPADGTRRTSAV